LTQPVHREYRQASVALEIPKEDTKSIATLSAFSNGSMDALISVLSTAPLMSNPKAMAEHVAKAVPSIPLDQVAAVLGTLYTLYHIRELSGVKSERFLEDLMGGVEKIRGLKLDDTQFSRLRSLLEKLLDVDALRTVAKAARLQRDGERLYCTSKFLSDVRPVFGKDATREPLGVVLTHTLKIGYHEGKEHKEFHVVLDSNDLQSIGKAVQRAKAKDKTLRDMLKSLNLRSLDD